MRRVLPVVTIIWVASMLLSLKYQFLDRLIAADPKEFAIDFFQSPSGFSNLLNGNNIFLTEITEYAPYGSPFFNHPLLAVFVGLWTVPFTPWTAYGLFAVASLLLLAFSAWLMSLRFDAQDCKAFCYFAMICSPVVYRLLYVGNMHIFVVVAIAMILSGLVGLQQNRVGAAALVQAGVLVALFSKPVVLLMLPALFLLPETRKKMLAPAAIYFVLSVLFLCVPRLNPGGFNAVHWSNLFHTSTAHSQTYWLVVQNVLDYSNDNTAYSLPRLLNGWCSSSAAWLFVAVPQALILAVSFSVLFLSNRDARIRVAIAVVILCVFSHYLCYFTVREYQYAAVLPTIPALLWMRRSETSQKQHRLLTVALLAAAAILLPSFQCLSAKPAEYWLLNALLRVVPMLIGFLFLSAYSILLLCTHVNELVRPKIRECYRPILIAGTLVAAVFVVAYGTIPNRLLVSASQWDENDWREHFESIVRQPGGKRNARLWLHQQLAALYAKNDVNKAIQHYQEADKLTERHDALTVEMASVFFATRNANQAEKLLATVASDSIKEPNVKKRYWELKKMLEK